MSQATPKNTINENPSESITAFSTLSQKIKSLLSLSFAYDILTGSFPFPIKYDGAPN